MTFTYSGLNLFCSVCIFGILVACAPSTKIVTPFPVSEASTIVVTKPAPTVLSTLSRLTSSTSASQSGCVLPPIQISNSDIRRFYWSEDSKLILFKEKAGQVWYRYNIATGETATDIAEFPATSADVFHRFDIQNYQEAFISPSNEIVVFTRKVAEIYEVYYKYLNAKQEQYLGKIYGSIKKVDWFSDETNAILAMDWQAPVVQDAYVYLISFSESQFTIVMPVPGHYWNVEYLGLTPDNARFMFVSYDGNPIVRLWNVATNEVSDTTMFNPRSFHWISENEIISVNPNRDELFFVDVLLYNIDTSETTYLADSKFDLAPFIQNGLISPDGTSVAYIENKTDNLYWTKCVQDR